MTSFTFFEALRMFALHGEKHESFLRWKDILPIRIITLHDFWERRSLCDRFVNIYPHYMEAGALGSYIVFQLAWDNSGNACVYCVFEDTDNIEPLDATIQVDKTICHHATIPECCFT
jgi:hypothetical protein